MKCPYSIVSLLGALMGIILQIQGPNSIEDRRSVATEPLDPIVFHARSGTLMSHERICSHHPHFPIYMTL